MQTEEAVLRRGDVVAENVGDVGSWQNNSCLGMVLFFVIGQFLSMTLVLKNPESFFSHGIPLFSLGIPLHTLLSAQL